MMPVWLQMTAALSAALASGVMGMALVPFLKKMRLCEPEQTDQTKQKDARTGIKPTMCGLLAAFGILFGMVLNFTLYREFGGADLTSRNFAEQTMMLRMALGHGLLLTAAGFVTDLLIVRRRLRYRIRPLLLMGTVFLITLGILSPEYPMGLYLVLVSVLMVICWKIIQSTEQETDGVTITVNTVQLLMLTAQLLAASQQVMALYTLTAAGACMGCMVWNLHPAKCRLGNTGSFLFGSIIPLICILEEWWKTLALCMAVYVLNILPMLQKKDGRRLTLLGKMKENGTAAWKRIAMLCGFAAFCGMIQLL